MQTEKDETNLRQGGQKEEAEVFAASETNSWKEKKFLRKSLIEILQGDSHVESCGSLTVYLTSKYGFDCSTVSHEEDSS